MFVAKTDDTRPCPGMRIIFVCGRECVVNGPCGPVNAFQPKNVEEKKKQKSFLPRPVKCVTSRRPRLLSSREQVVVSQTRKNFSLVCVFKSFPASSLLVYGVIGDKACEDDNFGSERGKTFETTRSEVRRTERKTCRRVFPRVGLIPGKGVFFFTHFKIMYYYYVMLYRYKLQIWNFKKKKR